MLSMHESLARERMRATADAVAHERLVSRLTSERRWQRLAKLAQRRQRRAVRRADKVREAYSLAG